MIRIGIVGSGGMGRQRAHSFSELPDARVAAMQSRDPERVAGFCDEIGALAYEHLEDVLEHVDAVVVALPTALHAEAARQALSAGKHVLVEYPLCTSEQELDTIQEARRGSEGLLMVGNTMIHENMYRYVQHNRTRLGRLLSASSRVAAYDDQLAGAWYMDPALSGPIFACYHYHHVEYYRRLLGEAISVAAIDESLDDPLDEGRYSTVGGTLQMRHDSDATSSIQWYLSAAGAGVPRCFWLNGTDGSLTIVQMGDASHAIWGEGADGQVETFDNGDWGVRGSSAEFVAAIRGELDPTARLESDIQTMRIGWVASEAAQTNMHLGLR